MPRVRACVPVLLAFRFEGLIAVIFCFFSENLLNYVSVMVCASVRGEPVFGAVHFPFRNTTCESVFFFQFILLLLIYISRE